MRQPMLAIPAMICTTGFGIGGAWASLRYAPEAQLSPVAAGALAALALLLGGAGLVLTVRRAMSNASTEPEGRSPACGGGWGEGLREGAKVSRLRRQRLRHGGTKGRRD